MASGSSGGGRRGTSRKTAAAKRRDRIRNTRLSNRSIRGRRADVLPF